MTDPIAAWGFDEGTGTTAADATGGGGDLTLDNATWTTGHFGAAIENTASGAGASGSVPEINTPAVTLMSWVTPLDLTPGSTHWICGVLQDDSNTALALWTQRGDFGTQNVLQGNIRINGNLARVEGPALTVDEEAHVALSYDGTTIRLFLNAEQVASASVSGSIALDTTFHTAGAPGIAGPGVVDEERYFAAALDPTEIAALMDTPVNSAVPVPEIAGSLPVEITIGGVLEVPTPSVPELTGSLPIVLGMGGVVEMPTATIPELTGGLSVEIGMGGVVEAPAASIPELTSALSVVLSIGGTVEAPAETVPEIVGALPVTIGFGGVLEAPVATIPEITGGLHLVIGMTGHAGQRITAAIAPRLTIMPNRARLTAVPNRAAATLDLGGP